MTKLSSKAIATALCLAAAVAFAAPAAQAAPKPVKEVSDPIEPVNRFIFGFNDVLDHIIFEPIAKGYKAVVPKVVRTGVQNFLRNLETPLIAANSLLQGKVGDAGVALGRFVINTTVGVGGLVDVAATQGLTYKSEDFGQTLGAWGVDHGPYLVLPIIGPSSLRDGVGMAVDSYADPVRIYADNTDRMWIYYTKVGMEGLDARTNMIEAIDDMRRNSLDYYAAARSAYTQRRASLVRDEQAPAPDAAAHSADHP